MRPDSPDAIHRKGTALPLSDLIIAAYALADGRDVLTLDPHFKKLPGVKLHQP